jgi:hypothetical protein
MQSLQGLPLLFPVEVSHPTGRYERTHRPLAMAQLEQVSHTPCNAGVRGLDALLDGANSRDPGRTGIVLVTNATRMLTGVHHESKRVA